MRILILSFYYQPDLSAGSFRASALVQALQQQLPANGRIEVLTTLPNRYNSFSADASADEQSGEVSIKRFALPTHRSGMVDQAKAYISFARAVLRHTRKEKYDLVFATSSRLMTAVLAAKIARDKNVPLYLDIRDIFADTIKDVLPRHLALFGKPLFEFLEHWAISRADRVNLVSRGFSEYFETRYPGKRFSYFTNGIDDEFLFVVPQVNHKLKADDLVQVLYAGNLGEGQGLHAILPGLAMRMRGRVHFRIIGDGGRRDALRAALDAARVDNVELISPIKRSQLINAYLAADVLFLHLNDYDAFKKVLPSKLFEYGAMGKPIWAGVSGYAAEFVRTELENAEVFHPCDVDGAMRAFDRLRMGETPRLGFVEKFARRNIAREMAAEILKTRRG